MELVRELVEIIKYCCAGKGTKKSTIVGKLVVINFYHGQFLGLSVPMSNPLIRSVRQAIKRAHVRIGSQQKVGKAVGMGDADGDAGERSGMGGRREGVTS